CHQPSIRGELVRSFKLFSVTNRVRHRHAHRSATIRCRERWTRFCKSAGCLCLCLATAQPDHADRIANLIDPARFAALGERGCEPTSAESSVLAGDGQEKSGAMVLDCL